MMLSHCECTTHHCCPLWHHTLLPIASPLHCVGEGRAGACGCGTMCHCHVMSLHHVVALCVIVVMPCVIVIVLCVIVIVLCAIVVAPCHCGTVCHCHVIILCVVVVLCHHTIIIPYHCHCAVCPHSHCAMLLSCRVVVTPCHAMAPCCCWHHHHTTTGTRMH